MTHQIDARGLACPGPVLQARKIIYESNPAALSVRVDNPASAENVSRFLSSRDFDVQVDADGRDYQIVGRRRATAAAADTPAPTVPNEAPERIMIVISSSVLGHGDDQLGAKLMLNYLSTLPEMGPELWHLVFVNSGVKLTVTDSPALPALRELEAQGLTILVCGTCLSHFDLLEHKQVGQTTNMLDIVSAMRLANKVITL